MEFMFQRKGSTPNVTRNENVSSAALFLHAHDKPEYENKESILLNKVSTGQTFALIKHQTIIILW